MAIEDSENGTTQQPQGNQQSNAGQQPQGGAYAGGFNAQQQPQANPGLGSLNRLLQRSGNFDGSEGRSAEAVKALTEVGKKAVDAQTLSGDYELVRFDREANRVGISALLVMKTVKNAGKVFAIVRPLLLSTDAVKLKPRVLQLGHERIEVPARPQDVYNDTYWTRITEFLGRKIGIADLQVADAGPLDIPSDFSFQDEGKVAELLIQSVNRCDDVKGKIIGEQPFTVQAVKTADEYLSARLDFSALPQVDLVGHPVRSDIVVTMNRGNKTNQAAEQDFYDAETSFNSVSGFVNLEYTPPQQQQMPQWGQPPVTQLFTPTFVITQVKQAPWIQANTLELYMLAISNAYRVTAGTSWARAFLPGLGAKNDPRDIGALGYMAGQNGAAGQKIKTKGESFKDSDFVELMTTLVKPNPTFLIDVNPLGENAAIENILIDAAGGVNSDKATTALVLAANRLTGNKFSGFFDHTKFKICVPYGVDVHLGYYIDEHSEKRDIRDLDVLAMLNATQGNVQEFMNWYRTMCDTTILNELRLKQREGFERQYLANNLVITGRGTRLLLTPQFIEALDKSTQAAGVNVSMENLTTVFGAQRFAGNQLVGQYAVSGAASMNLAGQNQQNTYTTGAVTSGGRIY
jgi:hypothetical protein